MMKTELFFKIFNNKPLNILIFDYIKYINKVILKSKKTYKWVKVKNKPLLLAYYNYLDHLELFYKNNDTNILQHKTKFSDIVLASVKGNSLDIIKYFISKYPDIILSDNIYVDYIHSVRGDLLFFASLYGSYEIITYLDTFNLYQKNATNIDNNIYNNSKLNFKKSNNSNKNNNNNDILSWDYNSALKISPASGRLDIFKFLMDRVDNKSLGQPNCKLTLPIIANAARSNSIEIVDYFLTALNDNLQRIFIVKSNEIINSAINGGNYNFIKYYYDSLKFENNNNRNNNNSNNIDNNNDSIKLNETLMDNAADKNQFMIFKYLHERNGRCSTNAMTYAARNGNIEMLKWINNNRSEGCTTDAMDEAAHHGHLTIVQWLHQNRTEGCTTFAMHNAILGNHLETVKWLHNNRTEGCRETTIEDAAQLGKLDMIKWLHVNRPNEVFTEMAMNLAARYYQFDVVKWLHENRTEGCSTYAMDYASYNQNLDMIKWLHENRTEGCTPDAMDKAAQSGNMEILKWFHENRTEGCSTNAMDWSAEQGHMETVKWLHENRTEGCTTNAIDRATQSTQYDTVEWLCENRTEGCTSRGVMYSLQDDNYELAQFLFNKYSHTFTQDHIFHMVKNALLEENL